ncbi:MAG: carboxypeptidase-like regulatory domain-containing protein [Draconibacterium sp.]
MRIIQVFIYLLIFPVCSWAQKASLSGKVADATSNEPLPFVNVMVAGTGIGTVTDTEGHFVLKGLESGFIRVVNYYSGAFPANRGNALSGVLVFLRAGTASICWF